jgi:DNA-binding transcriptional MerR regulator
MSSAAFAFSHKSAGAFRTISEVAIELDVPQHVLRFWESRFAQIRPVKRAGGRRYYRPEDIDLLKGIRSLLYSDGFTIKGVQKVLKDRGLRHVADVGRGCVPESAPQVIEKIVYVEKPAAVAVKKPRPGHLRTMRGMSLPFFDEASPVREFPVLDSAPQPDGTIASLVEAVEAFAAEDVREPAQDHERLEEILDELTGLKARLRAARERLR